MRFAASLVPRDLYYHREVVAFTAERRRIELITVTSTHGATLDRDPALHPLFPEYPDVPRARRFRGKPGIFVSARVVSEWW